MARISEQTIEHIRSTADIQDVVGRYVQLKKRGKNWFAPCPFHNEKTGSFSISPDRQIFKCFGCGVGGSVINFVQKIENIEFVDALKFLAEMYNIEIKWDGKTNISNSLSQQLYEINEIVYDHYRKSLRKSKKWMNYLTQERGLDEEIIYEFQLGLAKNNWSDVLEILRNSKISSKAIKDSGLVINGAKGYFDRFRNRIIFSLVNERSKICGFAGRAVDPNDNAKYMNSPESPIYHKSNFLYGLNKSKNFIPRMDQIFVVEGYTDLLQLYQNNFKHTVAVSGTAFTKQHARKLKRYSENIILIFDGDSAGISAAIRSGQVLTSEGIYPKIMEIPPGLDPDDMLRKNMRNEFNSLARNTVSLLEFKYKNFNNGIDSKQQLNAYTRESIIEISKISDSIFREILVKELADITKFREENIYERLSLLLGSEKKRRSIKNIKKVENAIKVNNSRRDKIEKELIQLCFSNDVEIRKIIYNNVESNWFENPIFKEIFKSVSIHLNSKNTPDPNIVMDRLKEKERANLSEFIFELDLKIPTKKLTIDCIIGLEIYNLKSLQQIKQEKLKENLNQNETLEILKEISDLNVQISEIKSKYNKLLIVQT